MTVFEHVHAQYIGNTITQHNKICTDIITLSNMSQESCNFGLKDCIINIINYYKYYINFL